jgi:beta-lactamase superfamily II metal-dependent hydrolase
MYEIDFLAVGDGEKSGDAIAMRFTNPCGGRDAVVIIDGGFADDGEALVNHVHDHYQRNDVDIVFSTHSDTDHRCGLPTVLEALNVRTLCVHRPGRHGYPNDEHADAVEELVELAHAQRARVIEPFTGMSAYGGALVVAGPSVAYYEQMIGEAEIKEAAAMPSISKQLAVATRRIVRRTLDMFPTETFFDDAGGDGNPRNNASTVIDLVIDGDRMLFTSDTGVPGLTSALDYLDSIDRSRAVHMFQLPHHASRHNLDRDTIERVLGPPTNSVLGTAVASVSVDSSNPAPRIANASGRRGYPVFTTIHGLCHRGGGAPPRKGWSPAAPLPPLDEDD